MPSSPRADDGHEGTQQDQTDIHLENAEEHLIAIETAHPETRVDDKLSALNQLLSLPQSHGIGKSTTKEVRRRSSNIGDLHDALIGTEEEHWDETQTLAVNHTTAPLTAKIVDLFEDCDSVLSEDRRSLSPWDQFVIWASHRSFVILLVVASFLLTISLFIFQTSNNLKNPSGNEPWVWSAIPGIVSMA